MTITRIRPDFSFEDQHHGIVCGIDEVGRGPLAGPVVAAAVVWRRDGLCPDLCAAVHDSKKLTAKKREYLYNKIYEFADVSLAECDAREIDEINILQATLRAMQIACSNLNTPPDVALIDGNKAPKLPCKTLTIIKGDSKSLSIAAASIIAKHYRDTLMQKFAEEFPHYGWERNAGYGTREHLQAIEKHGITPLHRRSFAPCLNNQLKKKI
ncbi:MAG TPA: ribonuclease HII [Alphaproteobacteria bacterium]|nr:ribonuclease HII [Alphaproteobacteria bacterium]